MDRCYLTACFSELPAENFGTLAAGTITFSAGRRGFTPCQAARCCVENLPKPVKDTASPSLSASVTQSMKASTAVDASRFESPLFEATLSMNSAFVTALASQRGRFVNGRGP